MKILILGGDGMLGHQLLLSLQDRHEVRVTLRQDAKNYQQWNFFNSYNTYYGIDVCCQDDLLRVFADFQPDVVINAVGIVKQRKSAKESLISIEVNALFPHRLALLCQAVKARLIHISTDCIFSGKKGKYAEQDLSDAEDLYGKSKYLGELHDSHCVTLRTSIIGLELSRKTSLIEWFLAQRGNIKGFRQAIYTGVTTLEMSRIIERVLLQHPDLSGVWQVSAHNEINKYDLLMQFTELLGLRDIQIDPDDVFICDRSLIGEEFSKKTGYQAPSWEEMLSELATQVKQRENSTERGIPCNA